MKILWLRLLLVIADIRCFYFKFMYVWHRVSAEQQLERLKEEMREEVN